MYFTLLCKIIKSDKFENQRSAIVLNKPNDEFPTYINWHKNYTKACGIEAGKVYVLDIFKEPEQKKGYDVYKIQKSLELGAMT
tara:strand:+ start:1118 stop:1366 length:249 start_codon:yes stop_codon:yes gene_type:complete